MSIFNTDFTDVNSALSDTVGFNLDDISKIEPFKDAYSTAWFVIFMSFIAVFLLLIAIAFLYSLCDCVCSCCCSSRSGTPRNKVRNGDGDTEMRRRN